MVEAGRRRDQHVLLRPALQIVAAAKTGASAIFVPVEFSEQTAAAQIRARAGESLESVRTASSETPALANAFAAGIRRLYYRSNTGKGVSDSTACGHRSGIVIGVGIGIGAGSYVGHESIIGERLALIYPNVTIRERTRIGSRGMRSIAVLRSAPMVLVLNLSTVVTKRFPKSESFRSMTGARLRETQPLIEPDSVELGFRKEVKIATRVDRHSASLGNTPSSRRRLESRQHIGSEKVMMAGQVGISAHLDD